MRTVEEIYTQIAVHRDNIENLKRQIDLVSLSRMDGPFGTVPEMEEEILEEWGHIRELETERDELQTMLLF